LDREFTLEIGGKLEIFLALSAFRCLIPLSHCTLIAVSRTSIAGGTQLHRTLWAVMAFALTSALWNAFAFLIKCKVAWTG